MDKKPILFNTEMVRAILEDRKTVTRRVIKPRYRDGDAGFWVQKKVATGEITGIEIYDEEECGTERYVKPPYQVGDILYVRETWFKKEDQYYYRADFESDYLDPCETLSGGYPASCRYRSCETCTATPQRLIWHPSIHMPKEAARIFLKVTDVRVERLQDMTEDDVCSEGAENLICSCEHIDYSVVPPEPCFNTCNACKDCIIDHSYQELFGERVWNQTIKKKDLDCYGWKANPWVWVIEFERMEKENE